jgi:tRNA-2-methylthio-N6-dimethylallyladenosine synthase
MKTWGCQMNEYDSKRVSELLAVSHQLTLVDNAEEADVLIMNTCSIRENAQKNVYSDLGRWRDLKRARALDPTKPLLLIGVGGCVASQEGEALLARAPYVDIVFGPQTLHRVPDLIRQSIQSKKPALDVRFPSIEKFDNLPEPKADGPTAFVSIQEGCNKFCKYCIVPYTRGEEVNRKGYEKSPYWAKT